MNIGLYQSASSLTALERWQSAVSQNISSSQVPGFKKRNVGFSTELMGQTYPQAKGGSGDAEPVYFPKAQYSINFKQGEITPTRNELDIALDGDGFFVAQQEDGSKVYTRTGSLTIKSDRTITTTSGQALLSDGGAPIQMLAQGGALVINKDGGVYQGDTLLGRLQIVRFDNPSRLLPVAGGFIAPGQESKPVEAPSVMQGCIEGSNVTSMREMVDLVTISRAYEANQKVIQNTDGMLQKALDKLG